VSRGGAELAGFDVRVPAVDLAVDRKRKTVWFDDAYSNVGRIDASGTLHVYAEGSNASGTFVPDGPVGIAVDARGTVWVGELNFGTVGALGPSGTMQHYRPPSGSTPWGVLPQGGVLYFTDFGGDQLYRLDPAVYSAEGLPLSD
jgi:streptogramin lyase